MGCVLNLFKVGGEGSKVLITTRSRGIASITRSTMYELKGLTYVGVGNCSRRKLSGRAKTGLITAG